MTLGPHVENLSIVNGIPNLECAVRPPRMSKAIIPLEATVSTISPLDRKADERALHMKVLPVPP